MSNQVLARAWTSGWRPTFPTGQLGFDTKRLKVTVVATFEITSDETRNRVALNVSDALSSLASQGDLNVDYQVI